MNKDELIKRLQETGLPNFIVLSTFRGKAGVVTRTFPTARDLHSKPQRGQPGPAQFVILENNSGKVFNDIKSNPQVLKDVRSLLLPLAPIMLRKKSIKKVKNHGKEK